MAGPLTGFRVVDCSTGTAGPRMTGMLADYGADVISIEPTGGDRFRRALRVPYSVFNRGKRSVSIDVGSARDRTSLFDLLEGADLFVESWRPGVATRYGLGFHELHERFPGLVYCSISGFGQDGPLRDTPGHEALVHAIVGTMGEQPGHRDPPIFEGLPFASIGAAYLAAIGTAAAFYRRFDDGIGRHIETSLMDGALAYLTMLWGDADIPPPPRDPGRYRLVARNFRCSDGEIIGVHTGAVGAFGRLIRLLGLAGQIPTSETGLDMGIPLTDEQRDLLDRLLPDIFETEPRSVWLDRLLENDICAIPLLRPEEIFDAPQVRHNRIIVEVDDPTLGRVEQIGPVLRFSRTPADPPGPPPIPGADSPSWIPRVQEDATPPPSRTPMSNRPLLDGLRVLDLGAYYAVPYGSRLLADLGADVIRVESHAGDPNRGMEGIFRSSHAGKRSIALDLKHPQATSVSDDLFSWADVVHHSMRPGVAERIGVGYEHARAVNPAIVYAYGPGWGSTGPMSGRQSFAPLMSGYVGAAYEAAGQFNPPVYPVGNEDPGNGLLGAFGILLAMIHRRRTGEGQYLEHPQLNAAMAHMSHIIRKPGGETLGAMRLDPGQFGFGPLEGLYQTVDGWICLVISSSEEFVALGNAIGVDLSNDPRFSTNKAREENKDILSNVLADAFFEKRTAQLLSEFSSLGVPAAEPVPYNNAKFLRDPENLRTGRSVECPHDTRGRYREVGLLIRSSDTVPAEHRSAPRLGEHTDEILASFGHDESSIAKLRETKIVA